LKDASIKEPVPASIFRGLMKTGIDQLKRQWNVARAELFDALTANGRHLEADQFHKVYEKGFSRLAAAGDRELVVAVVTHPKTGFPSYQGVVVLHRSGLNKRILYISEAIVAPWNATLASISKRPVYNDVAEVLYSEAARIGQECGLVCQGQAEGAEAGSHSELSFVRTSSVAPAGESLLDRTDSAGQCDLSLGGRESGAGALLWRTRSQ
jgi:hypothetical protein